MSPASRWFGEAEKLRHLYFVSFPNGQNTLLCKAFNLEENSFAKSVPSLEILEKSYFEQRKICFY